MSICIPHKACSCCSATQCAGTRLYGNTLDMNITLLYLVVPQALQDWLVLLVLIDCDHDGYRNPSLVRRTPMT